MYPQSLRRPKLNPIKIKDAMPAPGKCLITMSIGQWDILLDEAYKKGWILLELDDDEKPVGAYRKRD